MPKPCLLFDLDGTLIDTAPDMHAALNAIRAQESLPALTLESVRPHVSRGGLALTRLGFSDSHSETEIEALRQRFLEHYRENICLHSRLFSGMDAVLSHCQEHSIRWGIVTNKPEWLTYPLLEALQLRQPLCSLVCGDTTKERKPHPLPLLTASRECQHLPQQCFYVGDDPRDIEAGHAAGMHTVAAAWGYLAEDVDIRSWQADSLAQHPLELIDLLESA